MNTRKSVLYLFILYSIPFLSFANNQVISDNGKTATLTLPLRATVSVDTIMRDEIMVTPLSGLFEKVSWDKLNRKFLDHHFLLRVSKDSVVPLLFEIINDQYTCSYNNPDWSTALPDTISVVNAGYTYGVAWSGGRQVMTSTRSAIIDDPNSWLTDAGNNDKFIDLTLIINFPDVSPYSSLMNKGGVCQGSITMLVSNKLN